MNTNIGTADKTIRLMLGLGMLVLGIAFQSWWGLLGLVPIVTALVGWCGLYALLGVSSCKLKEKPAKS